LVAAGSVVVVAGAVVAGLVLFTVGLLLDFAGTYITFVVVGAGVAALLVTATAVSKPVLF
jgi:hypothetical protein